MATPEQFAAYEVKVSAYFLVTLGRPASAVEMATYSRLLADNSGSVWLPEGDSLVSYLAPQLEAATAGQSNGQIVADMFVRMTGSLPSQTIFDYYVQMLDEGTVKLQGLANAMLNDLQLMPRVDGEYTQPDGWTVDLSGELTAEQREAMMAKTDVAVEFTAHLDTVEENVAFAADPTLAVELLESVNSEETAQVAIAQIDAVIAEIVGGDTNTPPTVADAAFEVAADAAAGAVIGRIVVDDADGLADIDPAGFSIAGNVDLDGDGVDAFDLQITAGGVNLIVGDADDIAAGAGQSIDLTVTATDQAGATGSGAVSVTVTPVSVNTPPTVADAAYEVAADAAQNTVIGPVNVADADGVGDLVGVVIESGNVDVDGDGVDAFDLQITAGGVNLIVADADDIAAGAGQSVDLTVTATDQAGATGSGIISVTVTGSAGPEDVVLDGQGTDVVPEILDASLGAFNFTDSAAVANNVLINDFGADDVITITGATSSDYDTAISSDANGDVTIAYNSDGTLNEIVLTGVAAGSFAFDVASFNALGVGDLTFA